PQWRDRLYIPFTRSGIPLPDVDPRPLAYCAVCDEVVHAIQSWKRPERRRIGKYGQQYVYRCPNGGKCRHQIVEPFVLPAAAAIDWSDLGYRIGDRPRPLAASTRRRIEVGLELFGPVVVANHGNTYERPGSGYYRAWPAYDSPMMARSGTPGDGLACPPFTVPSGGTWRTSPESLHNPMPTRTASETDGMVVPPFAVNVNHGGEDVRAYPVHDAPLSTRTVKIGDGLVNAEPFLTILRNNATATGVDEPVPTVTATTGGHHYLTVPPGAFLQKHHGGMDYERIEHMVKNVDEPMPTLVARPNVSLVVPYRKGKAKTTSEPLHTLGTRDSAALVRPAIDVDDCYFRMLKPREHLRAQRFPDNYKVEGNQGEQTMQAGNAVSANVAQWLGESLGAVL
ncbi:MAG: DNA cytosine methyltransferase, partial [Pseudonocardia sp.]|nr:DNA cytosine methyltransferase [Pseudonocardia sp.]